MPHLQELVERHENDPFALIGINHQDPEETYRKGIEDFGVSWISAYQGMAMSPITQLYHIKGFPTYLVLDTDGKIAYRGHSGKEIDAHVERLVAAAKSE